jgi:DNA-binding CsgD family transcriptional regulator/tetratricopeptide (TPR) repeat protein
LEPRPVPESEIIGRERELERIESLFANAKRNRVPAIARVLGRSGIGKTHFLRELSRSLEDAGWLVVSATCHMIQQHTPRLVCNRIVAATLERLGASAARYTGGLEDSLPAFDLSTVRASGVQTPNTGLDLDSYSLLLVRLFEGIAIDHDVALLCDDAQWMDSESARSLTTLAQKISTGCISFALAERIDADTEQPAWFPTDIALDELDFEQSLRLVRQEIPALDERLAELIAHHAGGIPFELVELCEELRENGTRGVEGSLRARTAKQLSVLEPDVREFVQICALLGDPIEHRILSEMYPDARALERLIDLSHRYVVNAGSEYRFKHAMLAQSVVSTIAVPIPLRRRIIETLKSPNLQELTDYERIAQHSAECGDFQYQRRALVALAKYSYRRQMWASVISAAERALQIPSEKPADSELFFIYILALRNFDREPEAVDLLMRELPILSRSSRAGLGQIVATLVIMLVELERVDQAAAVFQTYVNEITDNEERAALFVSMKYGAVNTADDELFAELEAQLESLRDCITNRALGMNLIIDAARSSLRGDAEKAREHFASAVARADPDDSRHIYLLEFAGMMYDVRDIGVAPLSARLSPLNTAVRKIGFVVYGNTCEAWEPFFRGDWESALRAVGDYYSEDLPVSRAAPLLAVAAAIAVLTGSDTNLSKAIEKVCFAALERGYRQSAMQLLPWWLVRHSDAALDAFASDVSRDLAVRPPSFSNLGYFPAGFAVWAAARSQMETLRFIASLEGTRDRSNWSRAHWNLTRGLASQAIGLPEANVHLNEAATSFRGLSAPFYSAYAAHHAGCASPEETKLLARLGVTTRSKPATAKRSPTDLTRREWDVARLVGDGASNRQIAEKLYVSERTVEVHLGNIFGKLSLSSRAQLVRWLFENEGPNPTPK